MWWMGGGSCYNVGSRILDQLKFMEGFEEERVSIVVKV